MRRSFCRCLLVLLLLMFGLTVRAQMRTTALGEALAPDLNEITCRAGMIFSGKVLRVAPVRATSPDEVASVQITFQVEQGVRGPRNGETIAFRE